MTGNAINAKSEALVLHELSPEELDAVSGGMDVSGMAGEAAARKNQDALNNLQQGEENQAAMQANLTFGQILQRS